MADKNPYPPGSARAKLWERRQKDRAAKAKAETPKKSRRDPNDVNLGDGLADRAKRKLNSRRDEMERIVEEAQKGRLKKMQENQSTDSNQ